MKVETKEDLSTVCTLTKAEKSHMRNTLTTLRKLAYFTSDPALKQDALDMAGGITTVLKEQAED